MKGSRKLSPCTGGCNISLTPQIHFNCDVQRYTESVEMTNFRYIAMWRAWAVLIHFLADTLNSAYHDDIVGQTCTEGVEMSYMVYIAWRHASAVLIHFSSDTLNVAYHDDILGQTYTEGVEMSTFRYFAMRRAWIALIHFSSYTLNFAYHDGIVGRAENGNQRCLCTISDILCTLWFVQFHTSNLLRTC